MTVFVYSSFIWFHHDRIEIDTSISIIVVSLTTWEAHHSPRASSSGCGELPRSLMRQQWPQYWYQFLYLILLSICFRLNMLNTINVNMPKKPTVYGSVPQQNISKNLLASKFVSQSSQCTLQLANYVFKTNEIFVARYVNYSFKLPRVRINERSEMTVSTIAVVLLQFQTMTSATDISDNEEINHVMGKDLCYFAKILQKHPG